MNTYIWLKFKNHKIMKSLQKCKLKPPANQPYSGRVHHQPNKSNKKVVKIEKMTPNQQTTQRKPKRKVVSCHMG